MPNIDQATINRMIQVTTTYPFCLPMMGIHPYHIKKQFTKQLYLVEEWLHKKRFIAVGEIGIDLYHDTSLCNQQQEAFKVQLDLAKRYHLPVSNSLQECFSRSNPISRKRTRW